MFIWTPRKKNNFQVILLLPYNILERAALQKLTGESWELYGAGKIVGVLGATQLELEVGHFQDLQTL